MTPVFLGIDIGGTHIRALSEVEGVRSDPSQARVAKTYGDLVDQIAELVTTHRATHVAVALPGRTWNKSPVWIPNLPFLDGTPLVDDLTARTGASVTLLNDAQAALVAETQEGIATRSRTVALVAIGTGIGGAILIDGRLYSGHTGTAGSFGWLGADTRASSRALDPTNSGPWERVAAGTSLLEMTEDWASVEEFLTALNANDRSALKAADEFSSRLAGGLASIASVIDPEMIVIVGGVNPVIDRLLGTIRRAVSGLASPTGQKVEIALGKLGARAGTVGALLYAKGESAG